MKLLITGGAGFIGANFIEYWHAAHPTDDIVCLDKLTYAGNLKNLHSVWQSPRFAFVESDICDREAVFSIFEQERFDAVVHFAAESHVDRSIDSPGIFLETNVLGTGVLLDACRAFGVPRFHQVSTDEVYGDVPIEEERFSFAETAPLSPSSPYATSKAAADLLALSYFRTYRLPVTISRCTNNYGPYQLPEKLIPLVILQASKNRRLPVYGDGKNVRDWIYVADHCKALDLILHKGRMGEIYNIGTGMGTDNLTVIKSILSLLDKPESLISFVSDRPGHDRRYAVDCRKAQDSLGFSALTSFRQGIKSTVGWYLSHPDWWENTT